MPAANGAAERELRGHDDGKRQQGQDDDDRARPIQVGRGERRQSTRRRSRRRGTCARSARCCRCTSASSAPGSRRTAPRRWPWCRRHRAGGTRRSSSPATPRMRRHHERGVAEHLERRLGQERADEADEVRRRRAPSPAVKNHTGSLGSCVTSAMSQISAPAKSATPVNSLARRDRVEMVATCDSRSP